MVFEDVRAKNQDRFFSNIAHCKQSNPDRYCFIVTGSTTDNSDPNHGRVSELATIDVSLSSRGDIENIQIFEHIYKNKEGRTQPWTFFTANKQHLWSGEGLPFEGLAHMSGCIGSKHWDLYSKIYYEPAGMVLHPPTFNVDSSSHTMLATYMAIGKVTGTSSSDTEIFRFPVLATYLEHDGNHLAVKTIVDFKIMHAPNP